MVKNTPMTFIFNPNDNGGEQLILKVKKSDNWMEQTLTLASYCNEASFHLIAASFTPDTLRELANQLERWMIENQVPQDDYPD